MSDAASIAAVVLAAGASSRFGKENKLIADAAGLPVVARCVSALRGAGLDPICTVVAEGADGDGVAAALSGSDAQVVRNMEPHRGIGASIACGVAAVPDTCAGVLIAPGDMPSLDERLLAELLRAFRGSGCSRIVYPVTAEGAQRNPVIWPIALRADLQALDGDKGAKALIASHRDLTLAMPPLDGGNTQTFEDIDTPEDLARYNAQARDRGTA